MRKISILRTSLLLLCLSVKSALALPIAEIKVEGAPLDQVETLKTLGGILPGDEYEKTRIDRAGEKLRDYLEAKGYPQVEVSSELIQKNERGSLHFKVKLGPALHIAEVIFTSKENVVTPDLALKLKQLVSLVPGELFDRDRIKEMRRSVETGLISLNFIDSRVADISTEVMPSGLKLNFSLELGQKVILSVSGNTYYTRAELMTIIEAQRELGLGRDFVSVLSNRLREQYVEHGFRSVKIVPYSFEPHGNEPKKVVFDVEEGSRTIIKSLLFDGNEAFTDEELHDFFFKNAADRIVARIYNEKMVEEASRGMIDELKKRGYLSAKLIATKTDELPGSSQIVIRFFLSEGIQTRIQAIDFQGNQSFDLETLDGFLGLKEGDPLSLVQLEDGIDRIKKEYRNLGRLKFKILNETQSQIVTYSEKNQFSYLSFEVEEGPVITLGHYDIFGNEKTKRKVIERELRIKEGEPLAESKVLETEENLRRLGIFSQVSLEFQESKDIPNARDMKISVQEAVPGSTSAGIGFRNDLGVRAFGGIAYSNLWGLNHTWGLDLSANRRLTSYQFIEYAGRIGYTLPWFIFGPTTFRPSISAEKRQYLPFNAETFAFSAALDRMLYRPLRVSGSFTYTLEQVREFNAKDASQNQQIRIGSITPLLRMDLRDNPLAPKKGAFVLTSYEFANSFLGTQVDPVPVRYGRYQLRTDFYWNVIPRIVWYNSARGGWIKNLVDPHNANGQIDPRITVPLIKQFALGGVNSVRGFSEQEINVQASDEKRRVQDYLTYVNYRTQIDFYATPNLSFGPFLDAGNLNVDDFSLGNLRYGTGAGMRYITPVGPVNFDWGFKLFPRPGESTNVFYFSLGVI